MDYDYNASITRQVVAMAHACGVSVEGEIGCLGSLETGEAGEEDGIGAAGILSHDQLLTEPEEAAQFVTDTGVDALAIACGTSHGLTNSRARRPAIFSRWIALKRFTHVYPTPIWSCMVRLRCRKIGWPSSMKMGVRCPRRMVCRLSR